VFEATVDIKPAVAVAESTSGPLIVVVPLPNVTELAMRLLRIALFAVKLLIVVVAKLVIPIEVSVPVAVRFVPVAEPKSKLDIEANADESILDTKESAVVVDFKFKFVKLFMVAVAIEPFTFETKAFVLDEILKRFVVGFATVVVDPFVYMKKRFVPELITLDMPVPVSPAGPTGPCGPVKELELPKYCAPGT
jgi:hypothetical protein